MARAPNGERGNWLREGKQPSATHAIEKMPQFRASLERFAERAGERLSAAFGALFTRGASRRSRNATTFDALAEHVGQPARAAVQRNARRADGDPVRDGGARRSPHRRDVRRRGRQRRAAARQPRDADRAGDAHDRRSRAKASRPRFATPSRRSRISSSSVESTETIEDDALLGAAGLAGAARASHDQGADGSVRRHVAAAAPVPDAARGRCSRADPRRARPSSIRSGRAAWSSGVTEASLTLTAILDEFQMSARRRRRACASAMCCRSATAVRGRCASNAASAACSSAAWASATAATRWKSKTSSPSPSKAPIRRRRPEV